MIATRTLQRLLLATCALFALGAAAVPQAAFSAHLPDFNSRPAARPSRAPAAVMQSVARRGASMKAAAPARRVRKRPPAVVLARCHASVLRPPASVLADRPTARGPPRRA